jgi:hypothetical protein
MEPFDAQESEEGDEERGSRGGKKVESETRFLNGVSTRALSLCSYA